MCTPHGNMFLQVLCYFKKKLPKHIRHLNGLACWSLTSLCHNNGHIETMPAREINPFAALTRIRSQFLRTQWSTSYHQRVDMTTPQDAQPSGLATHLRDIGHMNWPNMYPTYLHVNKKKKSDRDLHVIHISDHDNIITVSPGVHLNHHTSYIKIKDEAPSSWIQHHLYSPWKILSRKI